MSSRRARRPLLIGLEIAAALAIAGVLVWVVGTTGSDDASPPTTTIATVDLEAADAVVATSIADLAAASDCIVRGAVTSTDRGRAVGAADAIVVSKLVTIAVDDAIGECEPDVVVEQEGWLDDGTPVTVNGWPSTEVGDAGVWFLVSSPSEQLPYAATVSTAGSLRWRDGTVLLPDDAPEWLRTATAGGPDAVFDAARHG